MSQFDPSNLVKLLEANDPRAADEMDRLADTLKQAAKQLREYHASVKQGEGFISLQGFGDRVKINVVSPDGSIKQSIDTGG